MPMFWQEYIIIFVEGECMIENLLYLDPGTGLAIMAFIVSAIAGFGMFIRTKWDKIRHRMKNKEQI